MKKRLTQERLKELLHYDPDTGVFTWLNPTRKNMGIGDIAGTVGTWGYRSIGVDKVTYYAHRLVWLYVYGYFPEHDVDHIDRIRDHNQVKNLREATRQCNLRNTMLCGNNTSGVTGVSYNKHASKWIASIKVNYKYSYLGVYQEFDDAVMARLSAEQRSGWGNCVADSPAYTYAKTNNLI